MCAYAGVRSSVMIPRCPNSWPDGANRFSHIHAVIAKLFAMFPVKCTEAVDGGFRARFKGSPLPPERHVLSGCKPQFSQEPLSEICLPVRWIALHQ